MSATRFTRLTLAPGALWLIVCFALPLALIVAVSFASRGEYGTIEGPPTLANYARLAGYGELDYDPFYARVVGRSVALAVVVTLVCGLAALPVASAVAALAPARRNWALAFVTIPFWTSLIVRTYAWQGLLAADGWIARLAAALGLIESGTALQPGLGAVVTGMVCDFIPFFVLPLYASVEKIDWTLVEAARDLGATPRRAWIHAVWPQIRPGAFAGAALVFLPSLGQFVIPELLGGGKIFFLGGVIQQQFGPALDWPFGAALASAALAPVLLGLALMASRRDDASAFLR